MKRSFFNRQLVNTANQNKWYRWGTMMRRSGHALRHAALLLQKQSEGISGKSIFKFD